MRSHLYLMLSAAIICMAADSASALKLKDRRFNKIEVDNINAYEICTFSQINISKSSKTDVATASSTLFHALISEIEDRARSNNIALHLADIKYSIENLDNKEREYFFNAEYIMASESDAEVLADSLKNRGYETILRTSKKRKASCN